MSKALSLAQFDELCRIQDARKLCIRFAVGAAIPVPLLWLIVGPPIGSAVVMAAPMVAWAWYALKEMKLKA